MRNFISFLTIILCCLTVTPMHGRKKDKQADKEEVVLAMVEPDMMATPSHSHPVVAPVEEAYRHRINKNEHRYGIDVSRYQGDIDWQTVKTDKNYKAIHCVFPAGNAVVAATEVEEIVEAQWRDLGMPETLWHCNVKEFGPLIVSIDTEGRNLFEENKVVFNERKEKVYEEICKHVSFIK